MTATKRLAKMSRYIKNVFLGDVILLLRGDEAVK